MIMIIIVIIQFKMIKQNLKDKKKQNNLEEKYNMTKMIMKI